MGPAQHFGEIHADVDAEVLGHIVQGPVSGDGLDHRNSL